MDSDGRKPLIVSRVTLPKEDITTFVHGAGQLVLGAVHCFSVVSVLALFFSDTYSRFDPCGFV